MSYISFSVLLRNTRKFSEVSLLRVPDQQILESACIFLMFALSAKCPEFCFFFLNYQKEKKERRCVIEIDVNVNVTPTPADVSPKRFLPVWF